MLALTYKIFSAYGRIMKLSFASSDPSPKQQSPFKGSPTARKHLLGPMEQPSPSGNTIKKQVLTSAHQSGKSQQSDKPSGTQNDPFSNSENDSLLVAGVRDNTPKLGMREEPTYSSAMPLSPLQHFGMIDSEADTPTSPLEDDRSLSSAMLESGRESLSIGTGPSEELLASQRPPRKSNRNRKHTQQ